MNVSLLDRKLWGNFICNIIVQNIFNIDMGEVKVVGEGIIIVEQCCFVFDNVMVWDQCKYSVFNIILICFVKVCFQYSKKNSRFILYL